MKPLFALVAAAFLFSSVLEIPAAPAQNLGEASSPSWRILKRDASGRPVIVDEGTGEELDTIETPVPNANAPTEEQIRDISPRNIMRGQLLIVDPPPNLRRAIEGDGYLVLEEIKLFNLETEVLRVSVPPGTSEANAIRDIKKQFPGVLVDTNATFDLSAGRVGPDFSRNFVGWGKVPNSCGKGMRIGMIDGAVDTSVQALRNQDVKFKPFTAKGRKPAGHAHGTAVAAMLVGSPDKLNKAGGMLPGATLFAASIFETRGGKTVSNMANVLRATEWLLENRVSVVNLSIAGSQNSVLTFVLNKLVSAQISVVAAAGNFGPKAKPAWPAAHPKVIAVTAIDGRMKIYSSANHGGYVDFAAPGVNLVTATHKGPRKQSGTSFAAPFLTAMVAIHLNSGFPADPDQLRASLKRYARDLGTKGKDPAFGWGLVRLKPAC